MSVDSVVDSTVGSKTEILVLEELAERSRLAEKLAKDGLDAEIDCYRGQLLAEKSRDILVHGIDRASGSPTLKFFKPSGEFYSQLKAGFVGPVELYQYSPKKNDVVCVSRIA